MRRRRHCFKIRFNSKKIHCVRFLCVFIILIAVFMGIDHKIRPTIHSLAQNQAVVLSTRLIDEAISTYVEENEIEYASLMRIEKNAENDVTSIEANTMQINKLKAEISTTISNGLGTLQNKKMPIPIGTLFGSEWLNGRGPKINFYISLSGNVKTELVSNFYDAGINQTLHSISLEITTDIYIICPGYDTTTTVATNVAVAENIIVGEVPENYNYINTNPDQYVANYPIMD